MYSIVQSYISREKIKLPAQQNNKKQNNANITKLINKLIKHLRKLIKYENCKKPEYQKDQQQIS